MTTGQSDVMVVPREPLAAGGKGPILVTEPSAGDREKISESTTTGTTRSRKKVTFDLDLQVRTIPNRIPVYERRPAHYNNPGNLSRSRMPQSYAFVPKPLDIRGRDRYLIGAANLSPKKIVDLFRVPNGQQSYPSPPKGQARQGQPAWRRQSQQGYGSAATSGSSTVRHPAYAYDGSKSVKMSRAAANLKQITAALSEHFDASVYQEWTSEKKKGPTPVSASIQGISSSDANTASGTCNTVSPTPPRGFNPTKLKNHLHYRHQLSPQSISPTDSSQEGDSSRTSVAERPRTLGYSSGAATSTTTRKLPVVVTDQSSLSDQQLIISKAPSNYRPDVRRRSDEGVYQGSERFRRVPSARTDRSASRCSTIDSYVISEPFDSDSGPAIVPYPKSGRVGSGKKMMTPAQGAGRSLAWEGAEIAVTQPDLMANALRTVKPAQGNTSLNNPHWQVSSKPLNR